MRCANLLCMSPMLNLFADVPAVLPEELVTVLAEGRHVRIERIVSSGHASPDGNWYDQDEHEWVTVLAGEATVTFQDGDAARLQPGDHLLIPAHRKHRVAWTKPDDSTIWLAVFFAA
jgi:cupin 2 domain-containing protein